MATDSVKKDMFTRIVAVVGLAVALGSLGLASCQAYLTRKSQRLAVTPRVTLDYRRHEGNTPSPESAIVVRNVGIGPAEIKSLSVRYKGQEQRSWRALLAIIGASEAKDLEYSVFRSGTLLRVGFEDNLIRISGPTAVAAFKRAFSQMNIDVCYCSFYNECWQMSLPTYETTSRSEGCTRPIYEMDE